MVGSAPPWTLGPRPSRSATSVRSTRGSTPTFWRRGTTTPSPASRRAASRWSGVTSGAFERRAVSRAALNASCVLTVQRFGSRAMPTRSFCDRILSASLSTSAGGRSIPERPPRLGERHEVTPLDPGALRLAGLGARLLELGLEAGQPGLPLEHPLHA